MTEPQPQGRILSFLHCQRSSIGNYLSNQLLVFLWRDPWMIKFTSIKLKGSSIRLHKEPGRPYISISWWLLVEDGHFSTISALESLTPTIQTCIFVAQKKNRRKVLLKGGYIGRQTLIFHCKQQSAGIVKAVWTCLPSK